LDARTKSTNWNCPGQTRTYGNPRYKTFANNKNSEKESTKKSISESQDKLSTIGSYKKRALGRLQPTSHLNMAQYGAYNRELCCNDYINNQNISESPPATAALTSLGCFTQPKKPTTQTNQSKCVNLAKNLHIYV
jgi:hypothetical protein